MEYDKGKAAELTVDSIRLSARKHKVMVLILSFTAFAIAGGWAWFHTRQFYSQTIASNQEHLLDMARIEAAFLKNLLARKGDYSLEGSADEITVGQRGYIWIIDENGKLLSHPDRDQVGKDMMAIRQAAFPEHDWSQMQQIVQKMRNGEEGVGVYESAWWTEDEREMSRKLVGFSSFRIDDKVRSVAVCMSFEEIAGPIQENTLRTIGITALAVLLIGATSRTFYAGLKRENEALQREVSEHKKTREALERAHEILEQRVEERTAELKESNKRLVKEVAERTGAEEKSRELAKFPGEDPSPVLRVSCDGRMTYCNAAGTCLLTQTETGEGGTLPAEWLGIIKSCIETGLKKEIETARGGRVFSLIFTPIRDFGYVNIYGLDVTEHKCLEQQILRVHEAVLGSIGRDLHDGLLQHLTGVTYYCDTLVEELTESSSPYRANAGEISDHLRQLMTSLRDLAKGMYPGDWTPDGLVPALETLASTTSHLFKVSVVFECSEPIEIADSQVSLHLYRIAQEAVNNAVKHGNAKCIRITLVRLQDAVTLAVKDNGCGFLQSASGEGMGLQSIAFRAKAINAKIDIESGEGQGAVVRCSFIQDGQTDE